MHNSTLLSLTYLLQSGYTHHDLKTLFWHQNSYSPEDVWASLQKDIIIGDMHTDRHQIIREKYKKVNIQAINTMIVEKNIDIITLDDPRYPDRLKNI
jgi:predicted Rossmann fold nucleotide-binding protein DprA/Smf involved in DNA uptake